MGPSPDITAFQEALAEAKNIIILSGAGLSAPSGQQYPKPDQPLASRWLANGHAWPYLFQTYIRGSWQFYSYRRTLALEANPNAGHLAIASLNLPNVAARVILSASTALHITQNLEELALRSAIKQVIPLSNTGLTDEALGRYIACRAGPWHERHSYEPYLIASFKDLPPDLLEDGVVIPVDKLPRWNGSNNRYGRCGGLLRPDVVWFGEVPPLMGEIERSITWCDLLIVVGTSSIVQPASDFASQVEGHGGKIAFFNIERTEKDKDADFAFVGSCDEILPVAIGVREEVH
ncbi:DHS-like NAD/FAD-binding domain-containing protein [Coprinellus micaceus]|uniref:DHS-like NAD/FAD-binding domain-containing protein n=1 Tax=Coprinellus micaceus TaxID=71717 RepID=A0A4Y7TMS8_COPMI|nr:DHS-like NAD/FAD-binding domain-containing protein [Coprinellus micaceus]